MEVSDLRFLMTDKISVKDMYLENCIHVNLIKV